VAADSIKAPAADSTLKKDSTATDTTKKM
jgi:hypothetical protein